jgi:hypothetical protein
MEFLLAYFVASDFTRWIANSSPLQSSRPRRLGTYRHAWPRVSLPASFYIRYLTGYWDDGRNGMFVHQLRHGVPHGDNVIVEELNLSVQSDTVDEVNGNGRFRFAQAL